MKISPKHFNLFLVISFLCLACQNDLNQQNQQKDFTKILGQNADTDADEDAENDILDFYSTKDPFGEFSNFALYEIFVDGELWLTSEHYYQAHKYTEPDLVAWVKSAASPMEAALRGRDPKIPKRSDWNEVKDQVMEKAVRIKFATYPELQKLLLSTGNKKIYEHTKNDCYWGDCGDRTGKNKLGKLLEKIRAELRQTEIQEADQGSYFVFNILINNLINGKK